MDEINRMFHGVVVDGSSSFIPRESVPIEEDSDEEPPEELEAQTPVSIGSKRASNTSTTGSSPSKKSRSPAVRSMDNNMEIARIQNDRNRLFESHMDKKQEAKKQKANAKAEKIRYVQQLARECGANERNMKLWIGVLKITKDTDAEFFIGTKPEGRMNIIQYYAGDVSLWCMNHFVLAFVTVMVDA